MSFVCRSYGELQVGEHLVDVVAPVLVEVGAGPLPAAESPSLFWIYVNFA